VVDGRMISMGHSLPGRRPVARDTMLCADLCGVVHRYHGNTLRGHYFGEPPAAMVERYERAAGVFDMITEELHAGMTVGEVNRRLKSYYDGVGLSVDEGWALGYELGLSLPPDWVGDFYFHMADDRYLDRVFEPGMVTNFESLFDTALIETMVWQEDGVRLLGTTPPALSVVPL
jgi:Xaa-Pro aminopeptidase